MGLAGEARRQLGLPQLHLTPAGRTCWPQQFYGLLDQYGAELVWRVGLETLGFPPTWSQAASEIDRVSAALEELPPFTPT
ncbi:MAG: hypothetical protein WBC44_19555 [Planctomycetaceae bacterium]